MSLQDDTAAVHSNHLLFEQDDDNDYDDDNDEQRHHHRPALQYCVNLLDRPCRETPDSPCAVLVVPSTQKETPPPPPPPAAATSVNNNNTTIFTTTASVPLSYRQARAAVLEHQAWLQKQVQHALCLDEALSQQNKNNNVEEGEESVVIAYLSHNSIDLFLSVLACTSLSETTTIATFNSSHQDHDVIPALLNTRWTVQEMLSALQLVNREEEDDDDDDDGTGVQSIKTKSMTLVLYGTGMEQTAFQLMAAAATAASSCRPTTITTTTTSATTIHCLPIPTFALSRLCPGVQREILPPVPPFVAAYRTESDTDDFRFLPPRQNKTTIRQQQPTQATLGKNKNNHYSRQDAIIVFTSGTSSRHGAKGVRLSHEAIWVQMAAKCRGGDNGSGYSSSTALLASTLPFCHIGGLCNLWAVWMAGGRLIMPFNSNGNSSGSFDPTQVFSLVQGHQRPESSSLSIVNTLVVVPAMVFAMEKYYWATAQQQQLTYPGVNIIVVGGQSLSDQQQAFCQNTFPSASIVQTYACTEAASSLTFYIVPKEIHTKRQTTNQAIPAGDCVGKPPPHVQLCLLDKDLWKEKAAVRDIPQPFTPGVIATCGPHMMNGYWKRRRRQGRQQIDNKEWFVTNDLGYWDLQGNLYFCGRVNDAIRTGGETVMASEVEKVVLLHPDVEECAVFALPDPQFGETVACAMVCRANKVCPALEILREWCRNHNLAGYKQPRRLFQVWSLPKNSSGKTLKFLLVERFGRMAEFHSRL